MSEYKLQQFALEHKVSIETAKEMILDRELEENLVKSGKEFSFQISIITEKLHLNNADTKRRIRYIIKGSMGELNYYYRKLYIPGDRNNNWKKDIRKYYDKAKHELSDMRYSVIDYKEKVFKLYEAFLENCYEVFLKKLTGSVRAENLLRHNILNNFRKDFLIQTKDELREELKAERMADDYEEPEVKFNEHDDSDSEEQIMKAIQNGYGDMYGLG